MSSRPSLSVAIATSDTPRHLRRCLAALEAQACSEIIIADGSDAGLAALVAREVGLDEARLRVVHKPGCSLEELRDAAVRLCQGDVVAFTEARMEPAADWCVTLQRAHAEWPEVTVIGGVIGLARNLGMRATGLYLCEYAAYAPFAVDRDGRSVSAANVSYKRRSLGDLPSPVHWDAALHHSSGRARGPRLCQAAVEFQDGYTTRSALGMRFRYGRAFAAGRRLSFAGRVALLAGAIALPALLTARLVRAIPGGVWRQTPSLGAWVWAVALIVAWSVGEWTGYALGPGRHRGMV